LISGAGDSLLYLPGMGTLSLFQVFARTG
jgi:hypothetical protein